MEKKAVLVGIFPQGKEEECLKSLNELERLADTAGATTFAKVTQMKNVPDAATCIGKGKLEELVADEHTFYIDGFPDFTRQHTAILTHLIV